MAQTGLESLGERIVWSCQENESSGSSGKGLDQVTTSLQNGHSSIQSFLQHSVFNREGRQSQMTMKVSILREHSGKLPPLRLMSVSMSLGILGI